MILKFLNMIACVSLHAICIAGKHSVLTEFATWGLQDSQNPKGKMSMYSCLFQCERDPSCRRAEMTSEYDCILSAKNSMVREDDGGPIFIKEPISSCLSTLESGIYMIQFPGEKMRIASVFCKISSNGAWIMIQRRQDGLVDFYKDWRAYKSGFGDLHGDFWLGNDIIHLLTKAGDQKLFVEMEDWNNIKYSVEYQTFIVADESDKYRLTIGNFQGTSPPGDGFTSGHTMNGEQFTTYDSDNDEYLNNCAILYLGGWWYNRCHSANPNGQYNNTVFGKGINWQPWRGHYYSLKRIELMLGKK